MNNKQHPNQDGGAKKHAVSMFGWSVRILLVYVLGSISILTVALEPEAVLRNWPLIVSIFALFAPIVLLPILAFIHSTNKARAPRTAAEREREQLFIQAAGVGRHGMLAASRSGSLGWHFMFIAIVINLFQFGVIEWMIDTLGLTGTDASANLMLLLFFGTATSFILSVRRSWRKDTSKTTATDIYYKNRQGERPE